MMPHGGSKDGARDLLGGPEPSPVGGARLVAGEELVVLLRPPHARTRTRLVGTEDGAEGGGQEVQLAAEVPTEVGEGAQH